MGILPLKKRVNRDKCSFATKQRMFGVFAIDEILRYRGSPFPASHTLCHPDQGEHSSPQRATRTLSTCFQDLTCLPAPGFLTDILMSRGERLKVKRKSYHQRQLVQLHLDRKTFFSKKSQYAKPVNLQWSTSSREKPNLTACRLQSLSPEL